MNNLSQYYYRKPVKIIRDLVHGYINLTRFDLKIIDTVPFQRLSDVRQLTCQHVYPAARHTRFEHSLGVQEMMRNAIKHLNRNGILGKTPQKEDPLLISDSLEFNASVAALLHDVGHCPFSHMGEIEFNKKEVLDELIHEVEKHEQLKSRTELLNKLKYGNKVGSVHEQLSCIIILRKYTDLLSSLDKVARKDEDSCFIETDFELIIRSILGIEYDVSTTAAFDNNKEKNVVVRLLNSPIFDVDKLDYIMRDSHLTGIGTPKIDTQRLFRNMYLDGQYSIVFTSKAVPSLQNMIDARDGLYLYVYNHHAVVYSDFLNTYISRRLSHNSRAFYSAAYPKMNAEELEDVQQTSPVFSIGIVPKTYLFSVDAISENHYADSDWLSLLNVIHVNYQRLQCAACNTNNVQQEIKNGLRLIIQGELEALEQIPFKDSSGEQLCHDPVTVLSNKEEESLVDRLYISMQLIHQFKTRFYLKPWWKTVFEYTNFMNHYFRDDRIRNKIGKYICSGGDYGLEADEFRSQIAKCVTYITNRIANNHDMESFGLFEPLNEGDFFVIQRSPRFFSPDTIKGLEIALKSNEILGTPADVDRQEHEYYIKSLTNIIPQKDYSSIYAKEGFYVFSKQIVEEIGSQEDKRHHYELLEQIFAFVVKELVELGEPQFIELFQDCQCENVERFQPLLERQERFRVELFNKFAEKATV